RQTRARSARERGSVRERASPLRFRKSVAIGLDRQFNRCGKSGCGVLEHELAAMKLGDCVDEAESQAIPFRVAACVDPGESLGDASELNLRDSWAVVRDHATDKIV